MVILGKREMFSTRLYQKHNMYYTTTDTPAKSRLRLVVLILQLTFSTRCSADHQSLFYANVSLVILSPVPNRNYASSLHDPCSINAVS